MWSIENRLRTTILILFTALYLFAVLSHAVAAKTGIDCVPADALGYVQINDVYRHVEAVHSAPEWKELSQIEGSQIFLSEVNKMIPVVQMITGMTWQEFVKTFGSQITLVVMGISDEPDLALVFDVGESGALAQDAFDQLLMLMAADGNFNPVPEAEEYAGVTVQTIEAEGDNVVRYGLLDGFFVLAMNASFEPVVDTYKGSRPPVTSTPEHMEMLGKVPPSGTAYAYLNLNQLIPALREAEAKKTGTPPKPPEDEMEAAILASPKAMAVNLDLLGDTHEAYMRIAPQGPAMLFSELLLSEHPRLASVNFLPAVNGLFIGLQIGQPLEAWKQISAVAALMGLDLDAVVGELEARHGFYLEDDVLDALTGEFGIGLSLPETPVNLKERPLDLAKFQPFITIGVNDREKFSRLPGIISPFVQMDEFASSAEKGEAIQRGIVTVDGLVPGVALALWHTYADNLFIAGTSRKQVEVIAAQSISPSSPTLAGNGVPPWVLGYLNLGQVAEFFVRQNLDDNLDLPEHAAAKLTSIGAVQVAYGAEPEGVKLTLKTAPQRPWLSDILHVLTVIAYTQQP